MLDLNFVRENLTEVTEALINRNFPTDALNKFVHADSERRRFIAESDKLNATRNELSQQVGALMKEKRAEEALKIRTRVNDLKDEMMRIQALRDEAENYMRELLAGLPNVPHASVPVGRDETANTEVSRWGLRRTSILKFVTTLIWASV